MYSVDLNHNWAIETQEGGIFPEMNQKKGFEFASYHHLSVPGGGPPPGGGYPSEPRGPDGMGEFDAPPGIGGGNEPAAPGGGMGKFGKPPGGGGGRLEPGGMFGSGGGKPP